MTHIPWYDKHSEDYRKFTEFLSLEHVMELQYHLTNKQSINRLKSAKICLENKIFADIEKFKAEPSLPRSPKRSTRNDNNPKSVKRVLLNVVKKKSYEDFLVAIYFELYLSTELLNLYKSDPKELINIDNWLIQRKICAKNMKKFLSNKIRKNIIQYIESESNKIYDLIKN